MPPRKGSRQSRGIQRRDEIISAAVEEFATYGFRRRGLAHLAKRVGLTEAGLFHYFGSKRELLEAVLRERHAVGSERFDQMEVEPGRPAIEAYPEFIASLIEQPELAKLAYVLLAESLEADAPTHDYYLGQRRGARSRITQHIQAGIDSGEFRSDLDPATLATVTQAVIDGVQGIWLLDPDEVDPVTVVRAYTEMLLTYLTMDAASP